MVVAEPQETLRTWLIERTRYVPTLNLVCLGVVTADGSRLRGVVGYDNWHPARVHMHVAGEPGFLTKEFVFKLFAYPFLVGKVEWILAEIDSSNIESLRLATHIGFRELSRIEGGCGPGDDLVRLGMRRRDCKWLKLGQKYPQWVPAERFES